jgi:hypothetical protein
MKNLWILCLLVVSVSCHFHHDSISGNGEVKKVVVSEDTIRSITISNNLNALIIPSDTFRVELNADENLHEHIRTDINNGHLSVYSEKHIRMAKSKEVLIYTGSIEKIDASSGANVYNNDTLICNEILISVSSAADVSITGKFNRADMTASSGSDLRLIGSADQAIINLSSAADLHAYDFIIQKADVTVSSASDARVHVEKEARFDASSAADIRYMGNPDIIESRTSSAADIKKSRK